MGITIWIIGYLFFLGLLVVDDEKESTWKNEFLNCVVGLFLWPLFLGMGLKKITKKEQDNARL